MLRFIFIIVLLAAPQIARAQAPHHSFGLGLEFGYPSGLTAKYWLDSVDALQFHAGWFGFNDWSSNGPTFGLDWVHSFGKMRARRDTARFGFHIGAGGGLGWGGGCFDPPGRDRTCFSGQNVNLYGRMPIGFSAYFTSPRVETFAEISPAVVVIGSDYLGTAFFGSLGARFYF